MHMSYPRLKNQMIWIDGFASIFKNMKLIKETLIKQLLSITIDY